MWARKPWVNFFFFFLMSLLNKLYCCVSRSVDLATTKVSPYQPPCAGPIFAWDKCGQCFNLQFINESMCGEIKYTNIKHIEWAIFWYINQDPSVNVSRDVV